MLTRRQALLVAAAAVAAFGAAACTGAPVGDRSGGDGPTVTLVLATSDITGMPDEPAYAMFADRVASRSDGRLRVDVQHLPGGDDVLGYDQQVAARVIGGDLDLAMVPARAWDDAGVEGLRPLQAPFLVDSDKLVDRIVTSDLADDLLASLDSAGVHGIALWPGGLRHPYGFGTALLSAADFAGASVRVPQSRDVYALYRALGAQPVDLAREGMLRGVADGSLRGMDTSADLASTAPAPGSLTADVTLYARIDTVVVSDTTWDRLTEDDRDVLLRAALDARDLLVDQRLPEWQALARACHQGTGVAQAGPEAVAALRRLTGPLMQELAEDPAASATIDAIEGLKAGTSPDSLEIEPCEVQGLEEDVGPLVDPAVLDGTYRTSFTYDELFDASGDAANSASISGAPWTITLDGGQYDAREDDCTATYVVSRTKIRFTWGPAGGCSGDWSGRWELTAGGVRFSDVQSPALLDRMLWGAHEWVRLD